LTNTGGSSVTVSGVSIAGPGFNASGISVGQIIPTSQGATASVTFAPAATGSVTGSLTITSNASNSPAVISLSGTGATAVSHAADLTWTASTSVVVGYNVYRSTVSAGPFTKLTSSSVTATAYSDASVQAGLTYYYVVTAVNSSNVESAYSNEVTAVIP
jgi:fibronectin type 3 domain-containing protein